MEVFNFAFGPYPQRLNIYLAEKQPEDVAVTLYEAPNKRAGAPPSWVQALTTLGSLPILRDHDGTVIGQSLAILEYIEDRVSDPNMRGNTPAERAYVRQLVQVFDEALTFLGLWARHGSELGHGVVRSSQEVADICAARYFEQLHTIDRMIIGGQFLAAERVTIADCVGMAMLQYANDFYNVPIPPECANLQRWFDSFNQRPSTASPPYPHNQLVIAQGLMQQTKISF